MSIYVAVGMSKNQFRDELRTANEYMRHKSLPPDLRDRVREFYKCDRCGRETRICLTP